MHRVMYVFLPTWSIDRLRRGSSLLSLKSGASPAKITPSLVMAGFDPAISRDPRVKPGDDALKNEPPFATVVTASDRQLIAAVNPAAAAKGIAPGLPLADALSFLPGLITRSAGLDEDAA